MTVNHVECPRRHWPAFLYPLMLKLVNNVEPSARPRDTEAVRTINEPPLYTVCVHCCHLSWEV